MTESKNLNPAREEIARFAYHLWEAEGHPAGRDLEYWLQAESHLKAHREYEARLLPSSPKGSGPAVALATEKPRNTRPRRQTKRERERLFA